MPGARRISIGRPLVVGRIRERRSRPVPAPASSVTRSPRISSPGVGETRRQVVDLDDLRAADPEPVEHRRPRRRHGEHGDERREDDGEREGEAPAHDRPRSLVRRAGDDAPRDVRRLGPVERARERLQLALERRHDDLLRQLRAEAVERPRRPRLHGPAPDRRARRRSPARRARGGTGGRGRPGRGRRAGRWRRAARVRRSPSRTAASGDGAASPEAAVPATRSVIPARRPAERRRLRASFATIRSSHGRNGAPSRKRPSARYALTNPSCTASSASARSPAFTSATRNAMA